MKRALFAAAMAAAALAGAARAQPPPAAATPAGVADSWLVESHGQVLCALRLSNRKTKGGFFGAEVPAECGGALPAGVAGWRPTADGVELVGAGGSTVIAFERWSESLFVSTGAGAPDLQLSRAPIAPPRH
jgi:hypothetical protein